MTYCTAGASTDKETVPNPAALTAVACNKPIMKRVPIEMFESALFPISRMMKKNQSVPLEVRSKEL